MVKSPAPCRRQMTVADSNQPVAGVQFGTRDRSTDIGVIRHHSISSRATASSSSAGRNVPAGVQQERAGGPPRFEAIADEDRTDASFANLPVWAASTAQTIELATGTAAAQRPHIANHFNSKKLGQSIRRAYLG